MNNTIETDNELLYTPKISSPENYGRFLEFSGPGSLSDEEGAYDSGMDGYYEDELLPPVSNDVEQDLYPDLSSPAAGHPALPENVDVVHEPTEEQKQEWHQELEKIEGEIATLRQVLGSKIRYASELKKKLGITPLQEMKHDFELGIKSIKDSQTYQRTNEKLHDLNEKLHQSSAYQKTSAVAKSAAEKTSSVVSGIGSTVSKKLGDIRNSNTFKSVEGKMGSAYTSLKAKVSGSKSEGNFEEALLSDKENNANGESTGASAPLPEEKVPL